MGFPNHTRRRHFPAGRKTGLAAVALFAFLQIAAPVQANEINGFLIAAPTVITVEAGAERALDVAVAQSGAVPKTSMLLIQGLPQTSVLSAGRVFDSGVWALRFGDLQNLTIQTTTTASGQTPLTLSVVTLDGTVLAQREITLAVVSHGAVAAPREIAAAVRVITPSPPQDTPPQLEDVNVLLARGADNLIKGKIQVARLFYRRAAEQGSSAGAIAMAQTYDPQELAKLNALGGVQPDLALARSWYEKARELGARDVDGTLKRLSAR
jgi:hypothetical protein